MLAKLRSYGRQQHLALLALFLALGGTAYALARNEVKSGHIAPDAVTNKHTRFLTKGPFKKVDADAASQASARRVPLLKVKPFTIYGKCFTDGTDVTTMMFIKTSKPGAIYISDDSSQDGNPPNGYLDPGENEDDAVLDDGTLGPGGAGHQPIGDASVIAAQGKTTLEGRFLHAAKNGALAAGNGTYGAGKRCLYQVSATHSR